MLAPLADARGVDIWSDERLLAGYEWRPQLAAAIDRAALAVVLVSPDLLASEFVMKTELPALIGRGIPLACVLVRPCLWDQVPVLERVQWAQDPRRDGPLSTAADLDGLLASASRKIAAILPAPHPVRDDGLPLRTGSAVEPLEASARPGALDGVPALPPAFVARDELASLRAALIGNRHAVGITGDRRALGLHGQGGIGKSVLAVAVARDDEVRRCFPGGIFWVTLGETPDLVERSGRSPRPPRLAAPGAARGESWGAAPARGPRRAGVPAGGRRRVVAGGRGGFTVTGPKGRVLYTTRDAGVLRAVAVDIEEVDVLPEATARRLLAGLAGVAPEDLPPRPTRSSPRPAASRSASRSSARRSVPAVRAGRPPWSVCAVAPRRSPSTRT